ncbi:uncharacterized protein [Atheta coriaria]|uniref:uncharacterized protein n=1 Tax=Dalotia coriaria TaxID=877792 RepID=UPI0031F353C1
MKFLVVFVAALAVASAGHIVAPVAYGAQHLPVIGPNGVPIDTPAVQHATAAHLAHKAEAHARNGDFAVVAHAAPVVAHAAPVVAHAPAFAAAPVVAAHGYYGQPAAYPTTAVHPTSVNGVPLETPEVVAAKSKHFAAHAEALARTGHVAGVAPVAPFHHLYRRSPVYAPYAYGAYPYAAHTYGAYSYGAYPYRNLTNSPQVDINSFKLEHTLNSPTTRRLTDPKQINMKFLIVFACALAAASAGYVAPVAPLVYGAQHLPVIGANGVPVDTAEVQHARAAHFAHKAEAHARNGDYAVYAHAAPVVAAAAPVVASTYAAAPVVAYGQPAAYPTTAVHPASINGVPLETPEVVAAKSNHFAAHAEALARTGHVAAVHYRRRRGVIAAPLAYSAAYAAPYYGYAAHSPVVATSYAHGYAGYAHPYSAYSAYATPYAHYY